MSRLTRRAFLGGLGATAAMQSLGPFVVRGDWSAFAGAPADPSTAERNRLVVIYLDGGNDGLHTVAPTGDVPAAPRRSVYDAVRPHLAWPERSLLPLDRSGDTDHQLGLNPHGRYLHQLYRDDRLAIVQGVDYPDHSYSHFASARIWQSGLPEEPTTGWVGRHLDRTGVGQGELRAVSVGTKRALALRGESESPMVVNRLPMGFVDGGSPHGPARHAALARFADHPSAEPLRREWGQASAATVNLIERANTAAAPSYGSVGVVNELLTARALLESDLGVESVFVEHSGFDTHANQHRAHQTVLTRLDRALEAFFTGTIRGHDLGVGPLAPHVAERTLVIVYSEFGRRIGEVGGPRVAGTDHGAAAPVLLIGPSGASPVTGADLVPGLHRDHPPMGTPQVPADNLTMTTELRQLYQAVLTSWLANPDPRYEARGFAPLPGLFA